MWAMGRKSVNLSEQMENNYLSGARSEWAYYGVFGGVSGVQPAAGGAIFRKSILPPFRASGGKIRRENGFSVLNSICWCNLGAF
jgi:hypothetical protein